MSYRRGKGERVGGSHQAVRSDEAARKSPVDQQQQGGAGANGWCTAKGRGRGRGPGVSASDRALARKPGDWGPGVRSRGGSRRESRLERGEEEGLRPRNERGNEMKNVGRLGRETGDRRMSSVLAADGAGKSGKDAGGLGHIKEGKMRAGDRESGGSEKLGKPSLCSREGTERSDRCRRETASGDSDAAQSQVNVRTRGKRERGLVSVAKQGREKKGKRACSFRDVRTPAPPQPEEDPPASGDDARERRRARSSADSRLPFFTSPSGLSLRLVPSLAWLV